MPAASFIMMVCWFFARLGTPVMSRPRAASAFMRCRGPLADPGEREHLRQLLTEVRIPLRPARARARAAPAPRGRGCPRAADRSSRRRRAARGSPPLLPGGGNPPPPPPAPMPRALEQQRRVRDGPAVVHAADQVGVVDDGVVEEHLVEQRAPGHLPQRADGHARLVEAEREPRDARVLGTSKSVRAKSMPESASMACELHTFWPEMTQWSPSRVARRGEPGEIGTRPRLAEQLAPRAAAVVDGRDVAFDLLGRAVGEDGGRRHHHAEAARRRDRAERRGTPVHGRL